MKGKSLAIRIGFALHGLKLAVRRERSVRTQLAGAVVVLAVLLAVRPPSAWWAAGALAVGLVLVAELLNTALEILSDRLHPERHPEIRAVKDVAAAAVLVASGIALLVAAAFVVWLVAGG